MKYNVKYIACGENAFYLCTMTTIQVNERTKAGKALIETARIMAEKYKGIEFLQEGDQDDKYLLKKMLSARKSGTVSRDKVMGTLSGILAK